MKKIVRLFLLTIALSTPNANAQIVDPQNVLIQNVYLSEGGAEAEAVLVNILIRDNKLDIVTQDPVTTEDESIAVDARNGYLLGNLVVGESPSFLILNQDPRENIEVLLDTKFFTVFAIHNGRLLRNNLFESAEKESEQPVAAGWTAYTPPPMALPSSYLDSSKWNRWDSKYVSGLFIAAAVLDRQSWLTQNEASRHQLDGIDLEEEFNGGEIRGLRFGVFGTLNFDTPWVYSIAAATNAFDKGYEIEQQDNVTFFDWRVDIPVSQGINLSLGKQKEPISMERTMGMQQLPMQERSSVSDALLPSRNVGAVLSGSVMGQRMTWAGGIFNDWFETESSIDSGATQLIGRVTWLPFISEDDSNLLHLGLGLRHSNAKEGVRYGTEPEFNKSPTFVDTGVIDANDSFLMLE